MPGLDADSGVRVERSATHSENTKIGRTPSNCDRVYNQSATCPPKFETRPRVMIIDRDRTMATTISRQLIAFDVDHVASEEQALRRLKDTKICNVVIVTWDIPNAYTREFLTNLVALRRDIPAIVLIDDYHPIYEETALMLGASDVVFKSRGTRILEQRILLLIDGRKPRQGKASAENFKRIGLLTLRSDSCRAIWGINQVPLTLTEYRIVELMALNASSPCSYRQIYDVVHGMGFVAGDGNDGHRFNVRTLIKRIRKKFCELDSAFNQIETAPGIGYKWRGDVFNE